MGSGERHCCGVSNCAPWEVKTPLRIPCSECFWCLCTSLAESQPEGEAFLQ